jgi:hypothetical protein
VEKGDNFSRDSGMWDAGIPVELSTLCPRQRTINPAAILVPNQRGQITSNSERQISGIFSKLFRNRRSLTQKPALWFSETVRIRRYEGTVSFSAIVLKYEIAKVLGVDSTSKIRLSPSTRSRIFADADRCIDISRNSQILRLYVMRSSSFEINLHSFSSCLSDSSTHNRSEC